jgi:predicted CoA-substrate-specific enzyme activase
MRKGYLGVDVGSISTKAVVIDKGEEILAKTYLWTEGNPIGAVQRLLSEIERQLRGHNVRIVGVGTTGSARQLVGSILNATLVKNEITAHAVGALKFHPEVRTIFEIGGQDSKIIVLDNGVVVDYAMNTLCAAGTGAFLAAQARRLNMRVEEFGHFALRARKPTKIAGRCTVFAESDLVHKAQMGYPREDIIAGLCRSIVLNYLNNVGKGKRIVPPIVFQGGVSKNAGVVQAFSEIVGEKIIVDELGHLMGALGVAILVRKAGRERVFDFALKHVNFRTVGIECGGCPNNCEVVCVLREGEFLDGWGNRCPVGLERAREQLRGAKIKKGVSVETKQTYPTRLVRRRLIARETFLLELERPPRLRYQAGQFMFLRLPQLQELGEMEARRAMSFASAPHERHILVAMRAGTSPYKQAIARMRPGDLLEIEGPYGNLTLPADFSPPVVLLAGGIGIAPLRGMLKEEERKKWPHEVLLIYSSPTLAEAAFWPQLKKMQNERFRAVLTLTRLAPQARWKGERGRINVSLLRKYIPNLLKPHYYIVGLPEMVSSVRSLLRAEKVPAQQIHVESFTGYRHSPR